MKAAYIEATGGPEVIQYGELPVPELKVGEVLVRVKASAINPIDTYIRSGAVAMTLPKPFIPGCDFAGAIEALGPGVTQWKVGERVWGSNQGLLGRQGTFAEFAAVHEDFLYSIPAGISEEQVAAIALVGITAHIGLFHCLKLHSGETVFVNGGTGGVGEMVVQMAKAIGAKVITTVGSDAKAKQVREWGADGIINYKTEDVAAKIKEFTGGKGVNAWYETQREPDFDRMVELAAPRGRLLIMAGRQARPAFPVGPFYVKGMSLFGFAMFNTSAAEQRTCADDINRWLVEKKLTAWIGARLPLSKAAEAHRLQEENTLQKAGTLSGKIVVVPGG